MDSASPNRSGTSAADRRAADRPGTASDSPVGNSAAADGLVLLDKPEGITSFRCLARVKRVLGTRRVGHVGTLDPFASGLLGALTGRATRLAALLSGLDKRYLATVRFGCETDTLDPEGGVVGEAPIPELDTVRAVLPALTGRLRQRPPAYSAVHVAGRRAYELARRGDAPELPEREVTVAAVELVDWQPPDLTVMLTCSAGTYVRSWARDLGVAATSRAYVAHLRRLSIGPFSIRDAVGPDDFGRGLVLPPAVFLRHLPGVQTVRVRPRYRRSVVHGQPPDGRFFTRDPEPGANYYAALDDDDCLLAVLRRGGAHPMPSGWSYAGVFADR